MGFERVVPEDLSFDEQVATFQKAEWMFGAHGAGLTNVIFSPLGCRLVEWIPLCHFCLCCMSDHGSPKLRSPLQT
jgi:capsular polysaccharide biosynthesis protein